MNLNTGTGIYTKFVLLETVRYHRTRLKEHILLYNKNLENSYKNRVLQALFNQNFFQKQILEYFYYNKTTDTRTKKNTLANTRTKKNTLANTRTKKTKFKQVTDANFVKVKKHEIHSTLGQTKIE